MAFPIPPHLPRRANLQDVSSKILSRIDAATNQSLNPNLAASWLTELEETIQSTKERIHERMHADLPKFEQQLATSKSVQSRLQILTNNVDMLSEALSDPELGIIPKLLGNLTKHAVLAQDFTDANTNYKALYHLLRCRIELKSLTSLIQNGELPNAVQACKGVDKLLEEAPIPLNRTNVMVDLKHSFRAAKARTEDQLSDAFSRSIIVSPTEIIIRTSIQVRQSNSVLPLHAILSSLSYASLSNHLTTLRRDFTKYFIDHVLTQPTSTSLLSYGAIEHKLSLIPSPPNAESRATRLDNLSTILSFLSCHLFSCLPSSNAAAFTRSLCKPITTSLLNNLLIPSLPSSFNLLPQFLELVRRAVTFEERYVIEVLGNDKNDRVIKAWADGVSGHYERQRRLEILEGSRSIIIASENLADAFRVEVDAIPEPERHPTAVPVQDEDEFKDDAWGFEDDSKLPTEVQAETEPEAEVETEADSWGFDDDIPDPESEEEQKPINGEADPDTDPGDAWGWNDDAPVDEITEEFPEETAWDDPWSDEPPVPTSETRPTPAPSITSPKTATRLEKLASKGKKNLNGHGNSHPSVYSPVVSSPLSSANHTILPLSPTPEPLRTLGKRPSRLPSQSTPKETYLVSGRTRRIISVVEEVLNEGKQFASSKLFTSTDSSSAPGTILSQSAPSMLDLYRALYPVKFNKSLESPEGGMRFSNDCLYLSGEIDRVESKCVGGGLPLVNERLSECKHRLKVLGDSWFDDTIEHQRQILDKIIVEGAQGFRYTGDQDRYDECESAVSRGLQEIRRLAQRLKGILSKSKYYIAIGSLADAVLSKVMEDVLALPDIPEVESHRLSELCRILNALEGLFVEDPNQPSFVVAYVPSWLKFSYLSELLEASMVDITYLFEEGALVDFEVEELARLVRALFADTALRTSTINKLLGGHPVPSQ